MKAACIDISFGVVQRIIKIEIQSTCVIAVIALKLLREEVKGRDDYWNGVIESWTDETDPCGKSLLASTVMPQCHDVKKIISA